MASSSTSNCRLKEGTKTVKRNIEKGPWKKDSREDWKNKMTIWKENSDRDRLVRIQTKLLKILHLGWKRMAEQVNFE